MSITLPKDLESFLKELVERGFYDHPDLAICDALYLLKNQYDLYKVRHEELRQLIAVGIEQAKRGETAPLDIEAIKAKALRRLEEERNGKGSECPRSPEPIEQNST